MKPSQRKSSSLSLLLVLIVAQFACPNVSAGELTSKRASIVLRAELPSYAAAKLPISELVDLNGSADVKKSESLRSALAFHFDVGRMTGKEVRMTTGLAKYGSHTLSPITVPAATNAAQTTAMTPHKVASEKADASGNELLTIQIEAF